MPDLRRLSPEREGVVFPSKTGDENLILWTWKIKSQLVEVELQYFVNRLLLWKRMSSLHICCWSQLLFPGSKSEPNRVQSTTNKENTCIRFLGRVTVTCLERDSFVSESWYPLNIDPFFGYTLEFGRVCTYSWVDSWVFTAGSCHRKLIHMTASNLEGGSTLY